MLDVRSFGAKGDGRTNDTVAIQKAIDEAGKIQGVAFFPPGIYSVSTLRVPTCTSLVGNPTWGYKWPGGTVLRLNDPAAVCLLDISNSHTVCIVGMALDGASLGNGVDGIRVGGKSPPGETSHHIERTWIGNFSGIGANLLGAWAFWVRQSMFFHNLGDALAVNGSDLFFYDNTMIGNHGWGINALRAGYILISGNRIEWNVQGGVFLGGGAGGGANSGNLLGNQFDRNGGPGLKICGIYTSNAFVVTGNIFSRNAAKVRPGSPESCHIWLDTIRGLILTSNAFTYGTNDGGDGPLSPTYGIVCSQVRNAMIKDNSLYRGVIKQSFLDLGGCDDSLVIRDNCGVKTARKVSPESSAPQPPVQPTALPRTARPVCQAIPLESPLPMADDPVWDHIPPIGPFHRLAKDEILTQSTEVRVACDRKYLYLGVICWESRMDSLIIEHAAQMRQSPVYMDDSVEIFLAPTEKCIYHLAVNALGATWDARIMDGREETGDGEFRWTAGAQLHSNRWTATLKIRIANLTDDAGRTGREWGFNICRSERPWGELSSWAPLSKARFFLPKEFGRLILPL